MKAVIRIGYKEYVLDADKAVRIMEMLENAERYESKWHSKSESRESYNTYHVYQDTTDDRVSMELITDNFYAMCKLAGKPQD
jgi:hypothetical protein